MFHLQTWIAGLLTGVGLGLIIGAIAHARTPRPRQ